MNAVIKINNVTKSYNNKPVMKNITLTFESGSSTLITGPSGCGKTTLLRLISGLEKPDTGIVDVNGTVSVAFQEPRLLPWLNAENNVEAVIHNVSRRESIDKARKFLSMTGLEKEDFKKYPDELSGGMQGRVSLARALAHDGDILLFDEPNSGLDSILKKRLADFLADLIKKSDGSKIIIIVTHEPDDFKGVSNKILRYDVENKSWVSDIFG